MRRDRRVEIVTFAALALGFLYGTCVLPYRFPPRAFVIGASYEVGFNNAISYLAYLLFVPLLAVVAGRMLRSQDFTASEAVPQPSRLSQAALVAVIAAHVLLFGALYLYKGRFVFGEGLYFQSLLYRMSRGEIPYIDFSFYYGPLMLYPGNWLSRLAGLDAGYGIWFVMAYVVGLIFLYQVVSVCVGDDRTRAAWFVFLSLGLFNPLTGLNETFTRFLFPSIVFLSANRFLRDGGFGRGSVASALLVAAVTYSVEVAALSVGAVLSLGFLYSTAPLMAPLWCRARGTMSLPSAGTLLVRTGILLALAAIVCCGVFLAIDPSGGALQDYPGIARAYSGGAHNVPIYPHLPFLALAIVTVAGLAGLSRIAMQRTDHAFALVAAAYAVLAVIAQRAAFGAAEPMHFAYFGLPAFCIALFTASSTPPIRRAQAWLAAVLLVGIMLPMQYYHFMEFVPFFTERLDAASLAAAGSSGDAATPGAALEQDLRGAVRTLGTDRPYVMYEMEYSSLPVYRDFGLKYATYFTMLNTSRDEAGIARVIDEIRSRHAMIIARKQDLSGVVQPRHSAGLLRVLDTLSGAHTAGSELAGVLLKSKTRLMAPFLEFLRDECVPVFDHNGLVAFRAR